jgi:trigger factor
MPEARANIPAEIKRAVRQRCCFGCVICGMPVYHYEHMFDYAEVREHTVENITLLCASHHDEKTRGLRTREQVQAADANPFNAKHGVTSPFGLSFSPQDEVTMRIGSNEFRSRADLVPIVVDDNPVVFFQRVDDELFLNLDLRDVANFPTVSIEDNELVATVGVWDITFEGQVLTVRNGAGDVFLRIRFVPPARIEIERARIFRNGSWIEVYPERMVLAGVVELKGNRSQGTVFLNIGYCPTYPHWMQQMRFNAV